MSEQGDQMRAAATELQAAVRKPWTAGMIEVTDRVAALLRSGADAADQVATIAVNAKI